MDEYTELVKELRYCIDGDKECAGCKRYGQMSCEVYLMEEAAVAIKELSQAAEAIPHVCECCIGCELEKKNGGCDNAFILSPKRAKEYLSKPRWIPVTERVPLLNTLVLKPPKEDQNG